MDVLGDNKTIEIICKLNKYFKDDYHKIKVWLHMPNLNFGGVSPVELIKLGRAHKVIQYIDDNIGVESGY